MRISLQPHLRLVVRSHRLKVVFALNVAKRDLVSLPLEDPLLVKVLAVRHFGVWKIVIAAVGLDAQARSHWDDEVASFVACVAGTSVSGHTIPDSSFEAYPCLPLSQRRKLEASCSWAEYEDLVKQNRSMECHQTWLICANIPLQQPLAMHALLRRKIRVGKISDRLCLSDVLISWSPVP